MLFIDAVRRDEELARRVAALGPDATLAQLSRIGAAAGFAFSEDQLRTAYARDWSMRAIRFSSKSSTGI